MTESSPVEKLASHLLPIVAVEGENLRYTMEERLAHYHCPGVGVAVIDNGGLAWSAGYGLIEESKPEPVRADTMFSGASISKPVAAALALQYVERGVFDLDTDVNRYLKSWQVPENEFTRQAPVTLRWLLCHKAGTTIHGFGRYSPSRPLPRTIDILSKVVKFEKHETTGVTVDKVPGGSTRYSGGGTTIVEQMLEDVSGKRFHDLARENVFEPLGMRRSTFVMPLPAEYHAVTAVGHEDGQTLPEKFTCVPAIAAGALYTSPEDYARFMIACRNAYLGRPSAILGRALAEQMMTTQGGPGEFGLGWEIFGSGPNRRFGHGGSNDGYQCDTTCYLRDGKGAVVMTNAESGLIFYWEIFNGIADLYGWERFRLPPKRIQPIPESEFARYVGEYDIVSGVSSPGLKIWVEDGKLMNQIIGMRSGPRQMFLDQNGRFFNRFGPYETVVTYDANNVAQELSVLRQGVTEILHARRRS